MHRLTRLPTAKGDLDASLALGHTADRIRVRQVVRSHHFMLARRPASFSNHAISHALPAYMNPSGSTRRTFSASAAANRPPTLPRLPVPNLHETLSKYLRSLVPLLQENEAREGPSWRLALQQRQQWADEFERGLGSKCQERLHGKSRNVGLIHRRSCV